MASELSENERRLLQLIYSETLHVEGLSGFSSLELGPDDRIKISDLSKIGVRVGGDWLGCDPASRKARSRGLAKLRDRQFVTLHDAWGANVTHVKLTDAGRRAGEDAAPRKPLSFDLEA